MCRNGAVCRCLTKKLKGVWEQGAHSMLWSGMESTDLCPHSCSLCMSPGAAWKSGGADSASSCPPQESRRGKKSGNRLQLSTLLCGSQWGARRGEARFWFLLSAQFHAALVQKEGVNPSTPSGVHSASLIHDFPRCPTTKFLYVHLQRQHPHLPFLLTGDLSWPCRRGTN